MQKIGELAEEGFFEEDLTASKALFQSKGYACELIHLNQADSVEKASADPAWILIVRGGINAILSPINATADDLLAEQNKLKADDKALMYGRVVSKHARHNLCFNDTGQKADYAAGRGQIVAFDDVNTPNI